MKNIVIAGGGTGGHIYPAIAIAKALQENSDDVCVHFVGAQGGLEEQIIPKEGFKLTLLKVGKLNYAGRWGSKLKTFLNLPMALIKSAYLVLKIKPAVVLGVGGYASGPFVLVSAFLGKKTFIWEPNAVPGMTNRILSRFVTGCFVVFQEVITHLKTKSIKKVGLPVRKQIEEISAVNPQVEKGLKVLVFGGSQGSEAINKSVFEVCELLKNTSVPVQICHQIGKKNYEKIKEEHTKNFSFVEVKDYINDMPQRLEWASLVICRAGASTIAELMAAGRASILIPLPHAANNHQKKNAEQMVKHHAAEMITQENLSGQILFEKIKNLSQNSQQLIDMGNQARRLHEPKAAEKIARELLGIS